MTHSLHKFLAAGLGVIGLGAFSGQAVIHQTADDVSTYSSAKNSLATTTEEDISWPEVSLNDSVVDTSTARSLTQSPGIANSSRSATARSNGL